MKILYFQIVFLIVAMLLVFGIGLPFLISAPHSELVFMGFGLIIIIPVILFNWVKSIISGIKSQLNSIKKEKIDEKI